MVRKEKTQLFRLHHEPVMGWVAIMSGPHLGRLERVKLDGTLLGRDPECDIQIDDDTVSGRHAKIWAKELDDTDKPWVFYIQDLASTNGTYVNGEEVLRVELKDGDVIELGEAKLVFKRIDIPKRE